MDIDAINRERDKGLRRAMLRVLRIALGQSPTGELRARTLVELVGTQGVSFEDEQHALALIGDMDGRGYLVKTDTRTRKLEKYSIDHLSVRITPAGVDLLDGNAPVDPAVEDERIAE
jgi:hypothetical protein